MMKEPIRLPQTPRERKALNSIPWYFFYCGVVMGIFAAVMPSLKASHGLSDADLGFCLLAGVGGAILALPLVTYINSKLGSGKATLIGGIVMVLLVPIIGLQGEIWVLIIGIACLGAGVGCCDVSMNSQAILFEKTTESHSLGWFHCCYAMGGFVGAIYGGALLQFQLSVLYIVCILSGVCLIPSCYFYHGLFNIQEEFDINYFYNVTHGAAESLESSSFRATLTSDPDVTVDDPECCSSGGDSPRPHNVHERLLGSAAENYCIQTANDDNNDNEHKNEFNNSSNTIISLSSPGTNNGNSPHVQEPSHYFSSTPSPAKKDNSKLALFGLCCLGCLAYLGEGSVGDWSAVFLRDNLQAAPFVSSLGFACFESTVIVGRYCSDRLLALYSKKRLLQCAGVLASCGLGLVVAAPSLQIFPQSDLVLALLGFAVCGAGVSTVAPLIIALAGTTIKSMSAVEAVAFVTSVSYTGVMAGPPLIGGLTLLVGGLRYSLLVDAGLMFMISVLATIVLPD